MQESMQDNRDLDAQDLQSYREAHSGVQRRRAASRLLGRHQTRIYLWCFRFVQDHDMAMDLAQDVMLSAYKMLPNYAHRARFTSWLFIIVRNRCLNEIRRPGLHAALDIDPDELQTPNPGPLADLEQQDLWRLLGRHLDRQELEVLHLRCVEGVPVEGISDILKITTASGARGVLQRARRKLKAAFGTGEAFLDGCSHVD